MLVHFFFVFSIEYNLGKLNSNPKSCAALLSCLQSFFAISIKLVNVINKQLFSSKLIGFKTFLILNLPFITLTSSN